ncbi:MAG: uracil-DNA glycosylase [Candidatus Limiplasma sp.]|nr:uracil-DNA glycosylase [Clostridiales bacterium]MDY3815925.1 uracil-DNA glycosylase [Candidatus Limiplasma sp.]
MDWRQLYSHIENCQNCALYQGCTHKVPGQGDLRAPLMLIGEGPGQHEDEQGLAFVGPAGQLLTQMLSAIRLPRDRVYICNVVKCRPPHNRQPLPEEVQACLPYLRRQFLLVRPRVILLLGATAVSAVLGPEYRITRCHGQWVSRKGVDIIATYHPSALLRDAGKKRPAWEDLQKLRDRLKELELYQDLWKET